MEIAKIILKVEYSNGCETNYQSVIPKDVADTMLNNFVDWKNNTVTTVKELEDYQKKVKEYKFK